MSRRAFLRGSDVDDTTDDRWKLAPGEEIAGKQDRLATALRVEPVAAAGIVWADPDADRAVCVALGLGVAALARLVEGAEPG